MILGDFLNVIWYTYNLALYRQNYKNIDIIFSKFCEFRRHR